MTKASRPSVTSADPIQDVADRLLNGSLAMMDILTISLGARLGYYRLLMKSGALTPTQLAGASGTAERYAREWLEQPAVTGLLGVEGLALDPSDRSYRMLPGMAGVLADSMSSPGSAAIGTVMRSATLRRWATGPAGGPSHTPRASW